MFSVIIRPRIGETDALGHINNCALPAWFELARTPLFRIFDPNLDFTPETWRLVMVHSDYDYTGQLYCNSDVEVKTWISHIGEKSFTIRHEAWQDGRLCVKGGVVLVYYDFIGQKSEPIPDSIRGQLEQHLPPPSGGPHR
jgi:acyl-CoA thioester hydrolase